MNSTEVSRLPLALWQALHDIDVLWQVAIIAAGPIAAWWVNRLRSTRARIPTRRSGSWKTLRDILRGLCSTGIAFPQPAQRRPPAAPSS